MCEKSQPFGKNSFSFFSLPFGKLDRSGVVFCVLIAVKCVKYRTQMNEYRKLKFPPPFTYVLQCMRSVRF